MPSISSTLEKFAHLEDLKLIKIEIDQVKCLIFNIYIVKDRFKLIPFF